MVIIVCVDGWMGGGLSLPTFRRLPIQQEVSPASWNKPDEAINLVKCWIRLPSHDDVQIVIGHDDEGAGEEGQSLTLSVGPEVSQSVQATNRGQATRTF